MHTDIYTNKYKIMSSIPWERNILIEELKMI
jgi:hypothetical protein